MVGFRYCGTVKNYVQIDLQTLAEGTVKNYAQIDLQTLAE